MTMSPEPQPDPRSDDDTLSHSSPRPRRRLSHDVGQWLSSRALQRPSDTAFVYLKDGGEEAVRYSYAKLDHRARCIATWLLAAGKPGDRVLLAHAPGADFVPAFFGCLYAGMVAVPAYPPRRTHHGDRLLAILNDSGATLALGDAAGAAAGRALQSSDERWKGLRWMEPDAEALEPLRPERQHRAKAGDVAFLQYTSGSTGDPKGVMVTHGNLRHNTAVMARAFGFGPGSVMVSWLPLFHDMGLILGLLEPLYAGIPTVLMPPNAFLQAPMKWLQAISRWKGTHTAAPNFAYELCAAKAAEAAQAGLDLSTWRCAVNGAEPVRAETLQRFQAAFEPYGLKAGVQHPSYGLAEGTLYVSGGPGHRPGAAAIFCGQARGQRVRIVDPASLQPCPPGGSGEIWVQGPSVAAGYWGRPQASAETFGAQLEGHAGTWLRSGDLGRLEQGQLVISGRLKDLIILRGVNHYPQDIEATVQAVSSDLRPGSGAAFAVPSSDGEAVALVQEVVRHPKQPLAALADAIVEAVARVHGLHLQSLSLVAAGSVGRTSSGKIQRRACKQELLAGRLQVLHAYGRGAASSALGSTGAPGPLAWALQRLRVLVPGRSGLDGRAPLGSWGLDSLQTAEFRAQLEQHLGRRLPAASEMDERPLADCLGVSALEPEAPAAGIPAARKRWSLSPALASLWAAQALEPGSSAYHIAWCLRLEGSLDPQRLQVALQALAASQTVLRCAFVATDQGEVELEDQGHGALLQCPLGTPLSLEEARQWAERWSQAPFDPATAPLWRAAWLPLDDGAVLLAFSVHHLVFDQRSWVVFHQQLERAYAGDGLAAMADAPLGTGAPSTGQRSRSADYWRERLSGALPPETGAVAKLKGAPAQLSAQLDAAVVAGLRGLASGQRATLFTAAAAAWAEALGQQAGTERACFAVPMTVRDRPLSEDQVGYGVHPMPLLLEGQPGGDPAQRIRQASLALKEAMLHRGLSLAEAMRCGGLPAPAAFLVYQGNTDLPQQLFGLPVQLWPLSNAHVKAELALEISGEEAWSLKLEFDSQRVPPTQAHALLQGFILACQRLSSSGPVASVPRLSVLRGEQAEPSVHRTVIEAFHAQVSQDASATALVWPGGSMDRGTLAGQVRAVARFLHEQGVLPGQRVAVHCRAHAAWAAAVLGCFEAEAVYVPLDPAYPQARLQSMLEQAGCTVALSEHPRPDWAPAQLIWADLAEACLAKPAYLRQPGRPRPQDPAYIIFTSGSSGRPKGVQVPHGALANHARAFAQATGLGPQDRVLQFISISFDPSLEELLPALVSGSSVALCARQGAPSLQELCHWLQSMEVSVLHLPAAYWHACMQSGGAQALAAHWRLRLLVTGGEAPDPRSVRDLIEASEGRISFANAYGPTEACISATLWHWHPGQHLPEPLPLGRPLAGVETVVVDDQGQAVPLGQVGELWIGGQGLADGHLGAEALDLSKFTWAAPDQGLRRRFYRSGDRVRMDEANGLIYVGRGDRQVKAAGVRLDLEELESLLAQAPGVAGAVVEASGSGDSLRLQAWVCARSGQRLQAETLRAGLAQHLPAACLPGITVLDALPITSNGKIDRAALKSGAAPAVRQAAPEPVAAGAGGDLLGALVQAWGLALGRQDLGPEADFFALGGSSLRAVRLAAEATRLCGLPVGVDQVFQAPTPRGLEALLSGRSEAPSAVRLLAGTGPSTWVLLPPVSGRSTCYQALAARLGASAAVYGVDLNALPESAADSWDACVEQSARAIAAAVDAPALCLGGWSMGGLLAVDVARRLQAMGRTVTRLALLDAVLPDPLSGSLLLADEDALDEVFERDLRGLGQGDLPEADPLARGRFRRHALALGDFKASPLDVPLSLVLSDATAKNEARSGFLAWALLARAGMTTLLVPGDHYSVVSGPALKRVARRLAEDSAAVPLDEGSKLPSWMQGRESHGLGTTV